MNLLIVDNIQNLVTSSYPLPISGSDNTGISDALVFPQIEISDSIFLNAFREMLERDHASSPYTPHHIRQDLGK